MVGNRESGNLAKELPYVHLTDCCAVHLLAVYWKLPLDKSSGSVYWSSLREASTRAVYWKLLLE